MPYLSGRIVRAVVFSAVSAAALGCLGAAPASADNSGVPSRPLVADAAASADGSGLPSRPQASSASSIGKLARPHFPDGVAALADVPGDVTTG